MRSCFKMTKENFFNDKLTFMLDNDNKFYPLNPKSPFKNYKQALEYLENELNKKTILSNYNPTLQDFAVNTLFKSKKINELRLNKNKSHSKNKLKSRRR